MIQPKRLKMLYIPVSDMERARAFYEDTLGLSLLFADGNRWAQYKLKDQTIALAAPEETATGAKGPVPVFEVDDLEAACLAFGGEGSDPQIRSMGSHGRVGVIRDPDGNLLQLFEPATV